MYDNSIQSNVFVRKEYDCLEYSDGASEENNIFEILSKISDKSTFSQEIKDSISNWTTEYHFERKRHLLMRPFNITQGSTVLEVGCGCGAITRYLGETKAEVDAVEGTINRANIAGLRCNDLPNVKIFVDDFMRFESSKKYDFILFIGVLEYASKYYDSADPVVEYLKKAKNFLKSNGKIIIAIENSLGLKYYNWCGEDHFGKKFMALDGLYKDNNTKTYGRLEWKKMLYRANLNEFEFLFPFPDYKLPTDIITEKALLEEEFDVPAILSRTISRDYTGVEERLFSEEAAFVSLHKNGLIADMSNSFLIVCGTHMDDAKLPLAWSFSVDRDISYCTSTEFKVFNGSIIVEKNKLHLSKSKCSKKISGYNLYHNIEQAEYIKGKYYFHDILSSAQYFNSIQRFREVFSEWVEHIIAISKVHGDPEKLESYMLPGNLVDAIPQNYIIKDGEFFLIDCEWSLDGDIPTGWILFRGLANSLRNRVVGHEIFRAEFSDLISAVLSHYCISYEYKSALEWAKLECLLSTAVYNRNVFGDDLDHNSVFRLSTRRRIEDILSEQQLYIHQLKSKIDSSRSILTY